MKIIREVYLFFKRKLMEALREPVWVALDLTMPLLYIFLFSPLLRDLNDPPLSTAAVLDSFVPGILTIMAFSSGIGFCWNTIMELQSGVIERLRVTPVSRFSIMMGTVLMDVVSFIVPAVIVLGISIPFGFKLNIAGIAVLMLLLCMLTAAISAWSNSMALILKVSFSLSAVIRGIQLPLTLLSGALLPISLGPPWLRALAHINPLYYTVEASRVLSQGLVGSRETIIAFAVIFPLMVISLCWGTGVFRKAVA